MSCSTNCIYGRQQGLSAVSSALFKLTTEQLLVAAGTHAVMSAIFGSTVSRINTLHAATVALTINGLHLISHQSFGDEEGQVRKIIKFALLFFATTYGFPQLIKRWGYQMGLREAFKNCFISYAGIHFYNRLHLGEARG